MFAGAQGSGRSGLRPGPQQTCDRAPAKRRPNCDPAPARWLLLTAALVPLAAATGTPSIIIDQGAFAGPQQQRPLAAHFQPGSVFGARNRSVNFTHLALDELTNSVYVGATNWLFQLSAGSLRPELSLRTGPAAENPRDCGPADCLVPLAHVDAATLPLHHAHPAADLGVGAARRPPGTMHTAGNGSQALLAGGQRRPASGSPQPHNNYNKLLLVEPDGRQLLVCGSLNQGACRKHQLGQLGNYTELVPLPVASNDEHSSSVALVSRPKSQQPVLYVAATNSRLGPYRDLVPPISARYLEPASRAMQIIERSFDESARVDISSELRDYYLVNYVHAFQHQDFVYFATVQRKSPLRQLEEWGYITRLARLCASDLSFQSYTEMTLECRQGATRYNLLQDAQLVAASSHLAQHLGVRPQSALLVGAFALSRDHTTRSQPKSAVCVFPMERVEQRFSENIHLCYNGSAKARNMNYIAGAVNDCPKPGRAGNVANFCNEPLKLNGSLALTAAPVLTYDDQLISAIAATQAPTAPLGASDGPQPGARSHQVLVLGSGEGVLRRVALLSSPTGLRGHELDAVQLDQEAPAEPILADLLLQPAQNPQLAAEGPQFAIAATPHKMVKLRVNGCRAARARNGSQPADECAACAQLQDPFCGWCASSGSCTGRDECRAQAQPPASARWSPFDQIQCADYQPVWPQFVALQASRPSSVDVNVALGAAATNQQAALNLQLAQAHFACQFEYLLPSNLSRRAASTRASQARLSPHTSSVSIACPLPPPHQRPPSSGLEQVRVQLSVRLAAEAHLPSQLPAALGMLAHAAGAPAQRHELEPIERELTLYDCAAHSTCRTCLAPRRGHTCAWCPLSGKCTFDAADADLGCAAAAVSSTTPHSAGGPNGVRASHLTGSLDPVQASVFGIALHRQAQCPTPTAAPEPADGEQARLAPKTAVADGEREILVPSGARRSLQVSLRQPLAPAARRKLECLLELEGAKARLGARLLEANQVVCQESAFSYQEEVATQRAQLSVLLNDNQVIETNEVILYKCHLFGVSPPALTSSGGTQPSSAAWRAHELLQLAGPQSSQAAGAQPRRRHAPAASDCSLCLNVERKYQCSWCGNQCLQADQCPELAASTCPPPRIDSIHPTSGPLEGGTLLTIEGSNLGSNEREIQDKITVGGGPCQLVMYSVSTRIVCKTGPSLHGPQAATVFVGNRAGVTSAHEKFHYKAVHLTDVKPHIGPVSGGTRLTLSGSNLNVGSRIQVFLDDIPCALDSNDASPNQITCVTAPNLLAVSMRITRLTLMLDNSTHHLPYPFTYQPDPIITSIEPAESFLSGGRLIKITGQHLASPQSVKLMVYHEHKHNIINGTSCITQNDTLIICFTPAMNDLLASLNGAGDQPTDPQQLPADLRHAPPTPPSAPVNPLSYEAGGVKLKMSLFMDDVRSVRNLDDYYHHLPHYLTYFEDPRLFRLATSVIDYTPELVISGENLGMEQLDQDMQITIGHHICPIKSLSDNQVICRPPPQVVSLVERPILPIIALIGSNLAFDVGFMQYHSNVIRGQPQFQPSLGDNTGPFYPPVSYTGSRSEPSTSSSSSGNSGVAILVSLSVLGFLVGLVASLMFALSRFRQSKAEREYKRIQLQMGSLDINGQPMNGHIFENIQVNNAAQQAGAGSRALSYVGGALGGKKLFYQLNQQLPSFPPSPLTDISSLTGSNPLAHGNHVVKLSSNGTIINSTTPQHNYNSANSNSSQSSPGSTRNSTHLFNQGQSNGYPTQQQRQQQQHLNISNHDKNNLLAVNGNQTNARNFNWTQEAPSTIVPYAVIEACNLTLEGKNAIKDYV